MDFSFFLFFCLFKIFLNLFFSMPSHKEKLIQMLVELETNKHRKQECSRKRWNIYLFTEKKNPIYFLVGIETFLPECFFPDTTSRVSNQKQLSFQYFMVLCC